MGDRGNIKVKMHHGDGDIYLYTHWGGSEIKQDLAAALDRGRDRWNDESYLTRIIFCQMLSHYGDKAFTATTGFGIATHEPDNEHFVLIVDCDAQTVETSSGPMSFEGFVGEFKVTESEVGK